MHLLSRAKYHNLNICKRILKINTYSTRIGKSLEINDFVVQDTFFISPLKVHMKVGFLDILLYSIPYIGWNFKNRTFEQVFY